MRALALELAPTFVPMRRRRSKARLAENWQRKRQRKQHRPIRRLA